MSRILAAVAVALTVTLAFATRAEAGEYIVVLKDGVSEPATAEAHAKRGAMVDRHYGDALNGYSAELSTKVLAAVRADPSVAYVSHSRSYRIPRDRHTLRQAKRSNVCRSDSSQIPPTGVRRVGADVSSALSGNCRGNVPHVNVAVLDTGVDPSHPDLNVAGVRSCAPDGGSGNDVDYHGTFVAGVIGAADNQIGVNGVAPGANIYGVRLTDPADLGTEDEIGDASVLCGLDWAIRTRRDRDQQNDIHVVNMSFAGDATEFGGDDGNCGRTIHDPVHMAVCKAQAAGVVMVAAAGNEDVDFADLYPATYDEVLTASGIGDYDGKAGAKVPPVCDIYGTVFDDSEFGQADDQYAWFSNWSTVNRDRVHTIAAPGICLESTVPAPYCELDPGQSCYGYGDGTSYATPHVAGVVALCIAYQACKGLSAKEIRQKILRDAAAYNFGNPRYGFTGDPLRPIPGRHYGHLIRAGIY